MSEPVKLTDQQIENLLRAAAVAAKEDKDVQIDPDSVLTIVAAYDALQQRCEQAERERDAWKQGHDQVKNVLLDCMQDKRKLEQQLTHAKAALDFVESLSLEALERARVGTAEEVALRHIFNKAQAGGKP